LVDEGLDEALEIALVRTVEGRVVSFPSRVALG
jgi:hypothetical protein